MLSYFLQAFNGPSAYGWVITKDHINNESVGVYGPRDCPFADAEEIKKKGKRFRMFDDDGNLYYEGRFLELPEDQKTPDHEFVNGFEPLEDYGTPNAGCTSIQYWESGKGGGWKTL
jgi:hypothetical protein